MFQFKKATKEQQKLRLAIFGPSGAGKTFTGLRLATGLGGSIAVIDTERGSASKYADRFSFDVLDLPQNDINTYVAAIKAAGQAGYGVLIVDSLSHAWKELLDEVDRLAKAKYRGNTWSAWSEGTPKQNMLVDAILDYPGHVIATMRSKTEWVTEQTSKGTNKPVRVGLSPEQGKGIEYEFDILMEMSVDHIANIIKDRTGKYQDKLISKPDEVFGERLGHWLNEGKPPTVAPDSPTEPTDSPTESTTESTTKLPKRPWDVETLKSYMAERRNGNRGKADINRRKYCISSLNALAGGDDAKRHTITATLYGKQSTNDLDAGEVEAIIAWIRANDKNEWQPSSNAVAEAQAIWRLAEAEAGQADLDLFPEDK